MTDSPLSSADPDALSLLFERDPLTLSDAEIMQGIAELRRRRNVFASEEAAKALAPKKTRAKAEPQPSSAAPNLDKPISEIDLDDL